MRYEFCVWMCDSDGSCDDVRCHIGWTRIEPHSNFRIPEKGFYVQVVWYSMAASSSDENQVRIVACLLFWHVFLHTYAMARITSTGDVFQTNRGRNAVSLSVYKTDGRLCSYWDGSSTIFFFVVKSNSLLSDVHSGWNNTCSGLLEVHCARVHCLHHRSRRFQHRFRDNTSSAREPFVCVIVLCLSSTNCFIALKFVRRKICTCHITTSLIAGCPC